MLTVKRVNAALAEKGIDLTLVFDKAQYYPFHFMGPGVEFIHHSTVAKDGVIKKINDLPLDEWLNYADYIAEQVARQRERIKLPDWMKVGASVLISEGGWQTETTISRIYGDGSERVKIEYERGQQTMVWADGQHCAGPSIYPDASALQNARERGKRMQEIVGLFVGLTNEQQGTIIAQAKELAGQ